MKRVLVILNKMVIEHPFSWVKVLWHTIYVSNLDLCILCFKLVVLDIWYISAFLVLASEISYPDGFSFLLELRMKGSLWHWSKNTSKCRKANENFIWSILLHVQSFIIAWRVSSQTPLVSSSQCQYSASAVPLRFVRICWIWIWWIWSGSNVGWIQRRPICKGQLSSV